MQTHKQLVILTLKKYPGWVVSAIADEYLFAKQDGWMDIWGIVEKLSLIHIFSGHFSRAG